MNQSDFAKLHGVSRKTVTLWKARGWLVSAKGVIDVEASNAQVERYRKSVTHPKKTGQGNGLGNKGNSLPKLLPNTSDDETPEQTATRILGTKGATMSLDEARRMKENYLALLHQLDYDQKSGLVVLVSDVATAVGKEYSQVRTRLLAIPAEQAPRIHRLKTVTEVQDVLQELITEALEELTSDGG